MRLIRMLAALSLVALPVAAEDAPAAPGVRVAELLAIPDGQAGQREFVELANTGATAVDLAGWRLRDAPTASNSTNEFTFPAYVLEPGQRVVVWSNGTGNASGFAWSTSASKTVWNDAGDAATLVAPDGTAVDWLGYGSTTQVPPPGIGATKQAAPGKGRSLQLDGGAWKVAEPTPGLAFGQSGGSLAARVLNVAPVATLGAPAAARPGEAIAVHVRVADDNGDADIASWTLRSQGQAVRQGNASHDGQVALAAPAQAGAWTLELVAVDAAGANATVAATVTVQLPRLSVRMPAGGALRLPDLRPGDRNVTSLDAFTLRNEGSEAAVPLIDVSALRSGSARIPVDGNLWLGLSPVAGGNTTWVPYAGALQPLPSLGPGVEVQVRLRLAAVPVPAASGLYGTTFTVVTA